MKFGLLNWFGQQGVQGQPYQDVQMPQPMSLMPGAQDPNAAVQNLPPESWQDRIGGLFGGGMGPADGGLSPEVQKRAQQQAMLMAGLQMMSASSRKVGPRTGLGEILSSGLQAGSQGYQGALKSGLAGQEYKAKQDAQKASQAAGQGIDWKTPEGWAQYAERLSQIPGREAQADQARKQAITMGKPNADALAAKMEELKAANIDPQSPQGQKYLGMYIEPKGPKGYLNAGDGNLFNQDTGQWIQSPGGGAPKFRTMTPDEMKAAGLPEGVTAQISADGKIDVINKPGANSGRVPAALIKLETEDLSDLMTADNSAKDLAALRAQLEDGDLKIGPVENVKSRVKNYFNISDPNSQNFGTFKASMEKLRNDSLRLNKGVQTEGDSVREWNAIFENINDQEFVKKRLGEIEKLNKRARDEREFIIQQRRQSVGAPEFDPSSIPQSEAAPINAAKPNVMRYDARGNLIK